MVMEASRTKPKNWNAGTDPTSGKEVAHMYVDRGATFQVASRRTLQPSRKVDVMLAKQLLKKFLVMASYTVPPILSSLTTLDRYRRVCQ